MTTGMPELGSKISLISKADIRYEGRLFTVDPQECTIALASVRSFGTEDRETQYPVPAQNQVYDYILFRGTDIKDIRVINNVTHPQPLNDPAIMQLSVPPTLGGQTFQSHPVLGPMGPQMGQFAGAYGGIGAIGTIGTGAIGTSLGMQGSSRGLNNSKPTSVLDLIGGSRSTTPASLSSRKSPTNDQGTQAGGSGHNEKKVVKPIQPPNHKNQNRRINENRDSRGDRGDNQQQSRSSGGRPQQYNAQQNYQHQQSYSNQGYQQHHQQNQNQRGNWVNNRGPMRMRGRTRGTGYRNNPGGSATRSRNTLKFDNDYDFEQANTEFEELRSQLGKVKIDEASSVSAKSEVNGDVDKKDDSGNETGAGEAEQDEEHEVYYDKSKSFFDKISCEAVERAKGKSQRTDWRVERKLNSETFGVAAARRGSYRGRGGFRGMGYRGGYRPNYRQQSQQNQQRRGPGPSSDIAQSSQQPSQQQGNRSDHNEKQQLQENIQNATDSVKKMPAIDLPPECSQTQTKNNDSIGNVPEPAMAVK